MNIRRAFACLLLLLLLPGTVLARKKPPAPPPPDVPTDDATLRSIAAVSQESKARQSALARQAAELKRRLAALRAKAKNPKIDLAEQLSKEDMDQVNLLSAQLRYLENAALIEEVRQRHLQVAKDIYQASFFVATMATEYVAEKGELDDQFEDFCQAKAKAYHLDMPVALLFNAVNYIVYQNSPKAQ